VSRARRDPRQGKVILVGAGPGNLGLLTLRGAAALGESDVVLHDELVSPEMLALAPDSAELINVGKRGHDAPTRPQEDINKLLIERARAGDTVVRLKGGDPFVFGRGGEEASVCQAAGVPFEVIPGISSALAAPAFACIPLSDRRHAASFAVVTGHKDPTRVARETRWAHLGTAVDTLVILMGMRNLPTLVEKLLEGGKPPDTPAAAIMHGTLPHQRVVEAPLAQLPDEVAAAGLGAPAAVVVGEVVRLRESLGWWEQAPLFGMRVLLTRAAEQAGEMVGALSAAGAEPIVVPTIEFREPDDTGELDRAIARLDDYHAVVFASSNAVRFFLRATRRCGVDAASSSARFVCVGPRTARALVEAGLPVHLVASPSRGGDAEGLLAELEELLPPAGRRFLLPRSQLGREVLARGLRAAGAEVDAVTAYLNLRPELDGEALSRRIADGEIQALTFTSPSTVKHLLEVLDPEARAATAHCIVVAVGATTARALREEGIEPDAVPAAPGGPELVAALVDHVRQLQEGEQR
jgi:uroporphyrinogen III methyltransferase/synthase